MQFKDLFEKILIVPLLSFFRKKISISHLLIIIILFLLFIASIKQLPNLLRPFASPITEVSRGLQIRDLIRGVKDELVRAESERMEKGESSLFKLEDFELEISYVVKANTSLTGKLEYELIAVDSTMNIGMERAHKIRLLMKAIAENDIKIKPESQTIKKNPTKVIGKPQEDTMEQYK